MNSICFCSAPTRSPRGGRIAFSNVGDSNCHRYGARGDGTRAEYLSCRSPAGAEPRCACSHAHILRKSRNPPFCLPSTRGEKLRTLRNASLRHISPPVFRSVGLMRAAVLPEGREPPAVGYWIDRALPSKRWPGAAA